jgi:hypothetical protein
LKAEAQEMKFAKMIGLPLTVIGLILYFPPIQQALAYSFGESAELTGPIIFASGWALLLGYIAFNLGKESQQKKLSR